MAWILARDTKALKTWTNMQTPPLQNTPLESSTIAVIGLGYVGLGLSLELGRYYTTLGYDSDLARVRELESSYDSRGECEPQAFAKALKLRFVRNPSELKLAQIYIIAVPTPITHDKRPDLSYLQAACALVGTLLAPGDIVVFESTTYPTCTRTFCAPLLESASALALNHGFYLGYSPERINPSDKAHTLSQVRKITSGSNNTSAAIIDKLYASIIPAGTHLVSSIEIAEACKALENAQRDVNIALMNEAYMLFDTLGLDMGEILRAASTKWNFLPFHPGLVGGHCISVDPYYLTHIAQQYNCESQLITAARVVNESMAAFLAAKIAKSLAKQGIAVLGSRVLVVGFAFKKDCRDVRNTKAPLLCAELEALGASVEVLDSLVDREFVRKSYGRAILCAQDLGLDSGDLGVKSSLQAHAQPRASAHAFESRESGLDSSARYDAVFINILHTCDSGLDLRALCKSDGVLLSIDTIQNKPTLS